MPIRFRRVWDLYITIHRETVLAQTLMDVVSFQVYIYQGCYVSGYRTLRTEQQEAIRQFIAYGN